MNSPQNLERKLDPRVLRQFVSRKDSGGTFPGTSFSQRKKSFVLGEESEMDKGGIEGESINYYRSPNLNKKKALEFLQITPF